MKDIMSKLAELEATAPKTTKKKMLKEDATTPPMNVSDKPASLKDLFETMAVGQKPIPVVGKEGSNQQTGAGFLNVTDPALQGLGKALGDLAAQKKIQMVVPTQPGQQPAGQQQQQQQGQPNQAGATGQPQPGQMQMKEKDEGKPGKNFAKIAKSAGNRYGSKEAGVRVAGAVRAKLAKQGKLEEVEKADREEPIKRSSAYTRKRPDDREEDHYDYGRGRARDDKMFGEGANEEHLVELSPKTLHSYSGKALRAGLAARDYEVANKRMKGANLAQAKLHPDQYKNSPLKAKVPANEGAKVDRMVKHVEKSERKLGKSKDKAEDIAWATANKRGMLDNKNKKKVKESAETEYRVLGTYDAKTSKGYDTRPVSVKIKAASEKEAKELAKQKLAHNHKNYKATKVETLSKKVEEADIPSSQGIDTRGAGLGAGRSTTTLEGKKPDFLDLDKDGNKKEPMKKAAADKKKKKVDESMNHRISAARLEGKSHGLRGHAHCGKSYEDLEEMKAYHEGYKEGLDECYGQGVYEDAMPATVPGMASAAMPSMPAMEGEMEEGNAFTAALARTPKGGKFSVGGKTFTDRTGYDAKIDEYAFESLDKQLNELLNEGLSVSVSKGQQNSPDSVTITAQDAEADQLLQLVKHAGLGLFGDENVEPSSAMSVQPAMGEPDEVGAGGVDIDVVDGSEDMLSLMQKLGGVEASGSEDYADEEGADEFHVHGEEGHEDEEDTSESTCNECGMMEAGCQCDKEQVEEVESEDQMEFEVAEDNAPDSGAEDSVADEDAEAKEDAALAGEKEEEMNESFFDLLKKFSTLSESKDEEDEEEDVTESEEDDEEDAIEESEELNEWANQAGKGPGKGTDASFEQDIEFMTKVIAGGLNKPKSTGQTTVPVIAGQDERMHDNPSDWAALAGIKKS